MIKLLLVLAVVTAALGLAVRRMEPQFAFFPSRGETTTPVDLGIRFESATVTTADHENLRGWLMHPATSPRAWVLYFHGNGGNLSIWLPILAGIVRQGYTVAAFDYRGYGASTGRPTERGLYTDVDAVLQWAYDSAPGAATVYWGRSLGTTMAAYAATKRAPRALILESGFPDVGTLLRNSLALRFLSLFSSYRFPTATYLEHVKCPVLVMHGDEDGVVPLAAGQALHASIDGPKEWFTITGAGHNDVMPPDPDEYWARVRRFIAQQ